MAKLEFDIDIKQAQIICNNFFKEQIERSLYDSKMEIVEEMKKSLVKSFSFEYLERFKVQQMDVLGQIIDTFKTEYKSYFDNILKEFEDITNRRLKLLVEREAKINNLFQDCADLNNVSFRFESICYNNYLKDNLGRTTQCVEDYVVESIRQKGVYAYRFNSSITWHGNPIYEENKILIDNILKEKRNGRPDIIVMDTGMVYFIEVKSVGDGLKIEQALWMKNHPLCKIIILYVDIINPKEISGGLAKENDNQ